MDDLEFFDTLYQGWSKTTGAENMFWGFEEEPDGWVSDGDGGEVCVPSRGYRIFAVDQNQSQTDIGFVEREEDAAWITALHGCFADLTRRLHEAVDEAERFDCEKDRVINELAIMAIDNNNLRERLGKYEPVGD